MTKLYLVRHGETVDNAARIMQGQTHGELNEAGIAQASHLAEELKDVPFDAIISSDLKRAVDTARIIARLHSIAVETTTLLRERDWGDFTGRFIPDLKDLPFPENVETMDQLLNRAASFLAWVKENYDGKSVLAVSHGIFNKAVRAIYHGKPMQEIPRMANAECVVLILQ